jgi:hypothetical protein
MKILILAQSRSGSTSLTNFIIHSAKAQPNPITLRHLQTPFNFGSFTQQINQIKNIKNLIIKIVDNDFYKVPEFEDYKNLVKHFDKVIGLTRKNDYENARSKQIAEHFNTWKISSKTVEFDENKLKEDRLNYLINESKKNRTTIEQFDIFQVTYEGLFVDKDQWESLKEYLGFDGSQPLLPHSLG